MSVGVGGFTGKMSVLLEGLWRRGGLLAGGVVEESDLADAL